METEVNYRKGSIDLVLLILFFLVLALVIIALGNHLDRAGVMPLINGHDQSVVLYDDGTVKVTMQDNIVKCYENNQRVDCFRRRMKRRDFTLSE